MILKKLFIAASGQHRGKTVVSVGLFDAIKHNFLKLTFMKPVGQKYLVKDNIKVDKDIVLMKEYYDLKDRYEDMNPIVAAPGFTSNYITNANLDLLKKKITDAYANLIDNKEFVLIEGTGHSAVGAVFDLSNAEVAKMLKAKVIIISEGGIGRPIDRIMLNKSYFESSGVEVIGAIVNKVKLDKYEKVNDLVRKGLARLGVETFGVLPYNDFLAKYSLNAIMKKLHPLNYDFQNGSEYIDNFVLGTQIPEHILKDKDSVNLLIIPEAEQKNISFWQIKLIINSMVISTVVFTNSYEPKAAIIKALKKANIKLVIVKEDAISICKALGALDVKTDNTEIEKIHQIQSLIKNYVDIDKILDKL